MTVAQLSKKFRTCYRTHRFITVFTKARHWTMSSVRWIQSTSSFTYPCHVENSIQISRAGHAVIVRHILNKRLIGIFSENPTRQKFSLTSFKSLPPQKFVQSPRWYYRHHRIKKYESRGGMKFIASLMTINYYCLNFITEKEKSRHTYEYRDEIP
jgi:hypothetical protein